MCGVATVKAYLFALSVASSACAERIRLASEIDRAASLAAQRVDQAACCEEDTRGLCWLARKQEKCQSMAWSSYPHILDSGGDKCSVPNLSKQVFATHGCREDDLCRKTAASVTASLVSCGTSSGDVMQHTDFLCSADDSVFYYNELFKKWLANTCQRQLGVFGDPGSAMNVLRSVGCPCSTLSTEASRSGAVLQRTADAKYILKRIATREVSNLLALMPKFPRGETLLGGLEFVNWGSSIVVMPNANSAEARGLHASWNDACNPIDVQRNFVAAWDVKPFPATSPERPVLLAFLVRHRLKLKEWHHFQEISFQLLRATEFLNGESLVDYSLLLSLFDVSGTPSQGCNASLKLWVPSSCIVEPGCAQDWNSSNNLSIPGQSLIHATAPGDDNPRCKVLCLTVLDYLMDYSIWRQAESFLKQNKWRSYHTKTVQAWTCLGDLTDPACRKYLSMGCSGLSKDAARDNEWCALLGLPQDLPPSWFQLVGCEPDLSWASGLDDCIDYEGMEFTDEDWNVRSLDGRTPMEACCLVRNQNGIYYLHPDW